MSPRGPKPAPPGSVDRQERNELPWQHAGPGGWRHGPIPEGPAGLSTETKAAWDSWFTAWWAWFWELGDVPLVVLCAIAYDEGPTAFSRIADVVGLTPRSRQDLRWLPPKETP